MPFDDLIDAVWLEFIISNALQVDGHKKLICQVEFDDRYDCDENLTHWISGYLTMLFP